MNSLSRHSVLPVFLPKNESVPFEITTLVSVLVCACARVLFYVSFLHLIYSFIWPILMNCRHFAIGGTRMRTSEFLAVGNNDMATAQTCETVAALQHQLSDTTASTERHYSINQATLQHQSSDTTASTERHCSINRATLQHQPRDTIASTERHYSMNRATLQHQLSDTTASTDS